MKESLRDAQEIGRLCDDMQMSNTIPCNHAEVLLHKCHKDLRKIDSIFHY